MEEESHIHETHLVKRLDELENFFMEVLITCFTLKKKAKGNVLTLNFGDTSLAILSNRGKRDVLEMIPDFETESIKIQKKLDGLLLGGARKEYKFRNANFPFRYVSGGSLPIIRYRGFDYYCLFYRDIFPIGWNIANGGSDSRYELLEPLFTIERELREEIMAIDTKRHIWYVFQEYPKEPMDLPEFSLARKLWQVHLPRHDLSDFEKHPIPINWLNGPDTLVVEDKNRLKNKTPSVFLNINATDFGIEVDKVAQIALDDDAVFLDGEINRCKLVDRVIGLFRVEKLNRILKGDGNRFMPDIVFHTAKRYEMKNYRAEEVRNFVKKRIIKYISSLRKKGLRSDNAVDKWKKDLRKKFNLCPVTQNILRRYLKIPPGRKPPRIRQPQVFICYGGGDFGLASKVFLYLKSRGIRAFFAPGRQGNPDFIEAINNALEKANTFLAVGTDPKNLTRSAPNYERGRFEYLDFIGRKKKAKYVSFITFDPEKLPRPLDQYEAVCFNKKNVEKKLRVLLVYVR